MANNKQNNSEIKHDPYAAFRYKEFRYFVLARLLLTIGIQMQGVIIGWQIYDITHDLYSLGLVGLAEAIPFIAVVLYGGHLADIISRKKQIINSVSLFLTASIFLLLMSSNINILNIGTSTWPMYVVIALTGIARGFAAPAYNSFYPQLVKKEDYQNSSAWNSTSWQAGAVSGPAMGGLIYGFFGVTIAYSVVATFILISIFCIILIKEKPTYPKKAGETLTESLKGGFRFVWKSQILLAALSLDLFAVFFGGATAMLPAFAKDILFIGPEGLGYLRAAPALGAVIMALVLATRRPMKHAGRSLLLAIAGFGLCMICFALSKSFILSFALLAISGALDNISVLIRSTILQLTTPDEMRGRVSSISSIFIGSSNEIGAFESGFAAKLMGLIPSVIFGGCMTLVVVVISGKYAPKLLKLNLRKSVGSF